jgi:ABC-type sugar transport system ATPase subunit
VIDRGTGAALLDGPAVKFSDVRKTFPGTMALKGVSLSVRPGTIHALVGENGSGKSTLIGVLGGKVAADPGSSVSIFGDELKQGDPGAAREMGVVVIHQELLIVPRLSARENVHLGSLPSRAGMLCASKMSARFEELQSRLGTDIPANRPAGTLSVAEQTMVEIMRALRREMRVLVLDEPSATLGMPDRERLYGVMRQLRSQGVSLVLISHDLDEVLDLADDISVLREGTVAGSAARSQWSKEKLVEAMLGEARADRAFVGDSIVRSTVSPVANEAGKRAVGRSVHVQNLQVGRVRIDELEVRPGEIVGIAGLVGSGRSTLLKALAGVHRPSAGVLTIDGSVVSWPRTVRAALKMGIALMPEDRKADGLILGMPSTDNATLSHLRGVARWSLLNRQRSKMRASSLLEELAFRGRIDAPVRHLSGGNQQKVLMAKWLHRTPHVLLIDEPTRGIDIGAKADVMKVISDLAEQGRSVIWVSSELDEVIAVSDRVLVMAGGRIVDELVSERATVGQALESIFAATETDTQSVAHGTEGPAHVSL